MHKLLMIISLFILCSCQQSDDGKLTTGSTLVTRKLYLNCTNTGSESDAALIYFYSNGNFVIESVYYDAINCSAASARERSFISGTYSFDAGTGLFTDRAHKIMIEFLTPGEVALKNSVSHCGLSDWQIEVLKDTTDNDDCMGGTVYSNSTPFTYPAVFNETTYSFGSTTYNRIYE